jgi:hypothetical protein
MRADFIYLSELISEFLSTPHIRKRLRLIHERDISGWEIWLQVELSDFLASHPSEPEWYREVSLQFDRRIEKEKIHFRPDFIIRKKGWSIETYAALEIKQHPSPTSCIGNMYKDISKVAKMRGSELNVRTIWALGLFKADPSLDLQKLVGGILGNSHPSLSKSDFIGKTGFAYLLL